MDGNNNKRDDDSFLFDPELLYNLDYGSFFEKCGLPANVSPSNVGSNLRLRPLKLSDYDKGFLQLLSELTVVGDVSLAQYEDRFYSMKNCHNTYYVTVIENLETQTIIATAALIIEKKFIHNAATRGRIEDVVVFSHFRGNKFGHILLATLTLLGRKLGCYKMSLECKDKLIEWYETFGYKKDIGNNYLVQRC